LTDTVSRHDTDQVDSNT